jgi:hypothetical protein
MARRIVEADGRAYTFSPDEEIPQGGRYWVILQLSVVDEMTGNPPVGAVQVESDLAFSKPRIASGGLVGLVGIPLQVFSGLAANNYLTRLTLRADGYIARQMDISIPHDQKTMAPPLPAANSAVLTLSNTANLRVGESLFVGPLGPSFRTVRIRALGPSPNQVTVSPELPPLYSIGDPVVPVVPADFAPTDIGVLGLHREALVLSGRIVTVSGDTTVPVTAATVSVIGTWRTPPPGNLNVPADPPNLVSLYPPLYASRSPAMGVFHPVDLMPVVGDEKFLLDNFQTGASRIQLSNRRNLISGTSVLLIDADRPDLAEYIQIQNILGASSVDEPASVTLAYPTVYSHRQNALVRRVNIQAPAIAIADKQFSLDAHAGDVCVFLSDITDLLNSATGLSNANGVQISGGSQPNEYHLMRLFSVRTDARSAGAQQHHWFRSKRLRAITIRPKHLFSPPCLWGHTSNAAKGDS